MRGCRVAKWVFYVLFVAYCLGMAGILVYSLWPPEGFSYVGPTQPGILIPVFFDAAAGGLVLFMIGRLLSLVGRGESPFSAPFVRIFVLVGIALLVSVICQFLIDPGTVVGSVNGDSCMSISYEGGPTGSRNIDLKSVIAAFSCFVLAAIFRYGALLQEETDDLV